MCLSFVYAAKSPTLNKYYEQRNEVGTFIGYTHKWYKNRRSIQRPDRVRQEFVETLPVEYVPKSNSIVNVP